MWNFKGPFGIIEHGQPGAILESIDGYNVDRALLDLMLENRVSGSDAVQTLKTTTTRSLWSCKQRGQDVQHYILWTVGRMIIQ